jgi:hypothetical protein
MASANINTNTNSKRPIRYVRLDGSTLVLVLSNCLTIGIALLQHWSLGDVLWVYWGQSVIIGYYNRRRMLDLKGFTTDGMTMNDQPVEANKDGQRRIAFFFTVHYGILHLTYLWFLVFLGTPNSLFKMLNISVCILAFLIHEGVTYWQNKPRVANTVPNIGLMMTFPYARIVPIHFVGLVGLGVAPTSMIAVLLFLAMKTIADVVMHGIDVAIAEQATNI